MPTILAIHLLEVGKLSNLADVEGDPARSIYCRVKEKRPPFCFGTKPRNNFIADPIEERFAGSKEMHPGAGKFAGRRFAPHREILGKPIHKPGRNLLHPGTEIPFEANTRGQAKIP
jgi:hypothetical protein